MANKKYIRADEVYDQGLQMELAPTVEKEIVADSEGRYIGQNGYTVDDLNMVGTGEYLTVTDWNKMPAGYTKVTNPYMAATPDQIADRKTWSQQGTNPNDMSLMSDEAYNRVLAAQKGWADTDALYQAALAKGDTAEAERLLAIRDGYHDTAEAERARYGYSGGADGSDYLGLMAYTGGVADGFGGYGNDGWGDYVSRWQSQIDSLTNAILGRDPFSYNKDTDPLYQQYKESYTRGGQRGMQDTLAQVSARTGGLASSYAQSAAQQTYNNYMAALADKVPELQQLAYSMYMDELNQQRNDLSMLMGLDDTEYGRWADDRNFDYGVYRDNVGDQQWQQSFDYNAAQDALDRDWQQMQWDYQVAQDALARQDALNKLYASSGNNAQKQSTLEAIYGMRNEAEVYDFLVSNNYSQGEVEDYLQYWRYNRYNKENNAVPDDGKVTVPEYGNITYDEVERLVDEGALIITGMDSFGNPTYAVPTNRKNPVKLTK